METRVGFQGRVPLNRAADVVDRVFDNRLTVL